MQNRLIAVFALLLVGCGEKSLPKPSGVNFRNEMRQMVAQISSYAKTSKNKFLIIPQNGHELITSDAAAWPEKENILSDYVKSIDGLGREDLFFGYDDDDVATPTNETDLMISYLAKYKQFDLPVLVTDYCSSPGKISQAKVRNEQNGFLSFVAESRELDQLPSADNPINDPNAEDITSLDQARNFLYLINPDRFGNRQAFMAELSETNYDVLIIDAFYDEEMLAAVDIEALKTKANGGRRLVVSYLSIGEAEDYRYYWNRKWKVGDPDWLFAENKNWGGNYKVAYWKESWKAIVFWVLLLI